MTTSSSRGALARDNAWFGCRRDVKDARDHMFNPRAAHLPAAVDLRSHCPPVMDQGELGSCTAHGITGALRYEMIRRGAPDVLLSRLQLYYDERTAEGTVKSDAGAEIRDGIKCAAKIGVAHEALWPYAVKKFATKPKPAVYRDAVQFKALTYQRVEVSAAALKAALVAGHTPIIGVTLYDSFESDAVAHDGMVPMPAKGEAVIGGHCLYVVGYGQKPACSPCEILGLRTGATKAIAIFPRLISARRCSAAITGSSQQKEQRNGNA